MEHTSLHATSVDLLMRCKGTFLSKEYVVRRGDTPLEHFEVRTRCDTKSREKGYRAEETTSTSFVGGINSDRCNYDECDEAIAQAGYTSNRGNMRPQLTEFQLKRRRGRERTIGEKRRMRGFDGMRAAAVLILGRCPAFEKPSEAKVAQAASHCPYKYESSSSAWRGEALASTWLASG
jgi:hypothetical protein